MRHAHAVFGMRVPAFFMPEQPISAAPTKLKAAIAPERLDADAVRTVGRLREGRFEAYLVGGCVRDLLAGRAPKDFDIATSATPNQIRALFRNCRLIGRRFRLAHIYFHGGKVFEVSTFRKNPVIVDDSATWNPKEALSEIPSVDEDALVQLEERGKVEDDPPVAEVAERDVYMVEDNTFGTAIEDARRRDFTINGLFYDPRAGEVLDYVRGLEDLERREVRTIGNPEIRMREDPVRILRGVRFAARLGFEIEPHTYAAMESALEDLPRCSPSRLLEETFRLLRGGSASPALQLIHSLGGLEILLPPVAAYLKSASAEVRKKYWDFMATVDAQVRAQIVYDDSMHLAATLMPLAFSPSAGDAPIDALLRKLSVSSRLPKRIAERARLILSAQDTLAGLRGRRGGLASFRAYPFFAEALTLFEAWATVAPQHQGALAAWKSGSAPELAKDAIRPRRRRRRRGRALQPGGTAGNAQPAASNRGGVQD